MKAPKLFIVFRRLLPVALCLLALSVLAAPSQAQTPIQSDTDAAATVLAMVNEWRIEEGLWPLKVNPVLQQMAFDQASFVLPNLENIVEESEYHNDANGHNPRERAVAAPYNWPTYGKPDQIEIGENAGVGSAKFALGFWKESEIHKKAALSNIYREVGVAALPTKNGFLFIMDFGARPDVFTTLLDPVSGRLFLSNERSRYASSRPESVQVRLFNSDGLPLTEAKPWAETLSIPEGALGKLYVLYFVGDFQIINEIDLTRDMAVMPGFEALYGGSLPSNVLSSASTATPAVIAAAPSEVPAQGSFSLATNTPSPNDPRPTQQPTQIQAPATATLAPTAVPSATAELLLTYNKNALTLFNASSSPINLTGISVGSDIGQFTVERLARIADFPVDAFPASNCLKASLSGSSAATPTECRFVRSEIQLLADKVFWTSGTFTVKLNDTVIATCDSSVGRCEIDLP